MSFSVQAQRGDGQPLVWSGTSLGSLFAQNATWPARGFWGMLADLVRFNAPDHRPGPRGSDADAPNPWALSWTSTTFWAGVSGVVFHAHDGLHLELPRTAQMLEFPVATMVRFCHNHGLLQVTNRPQWWTVQAALAATCEPLPPRIRCAPGHAVHSVRAPPSRQA